MDADIPEKGSLLQAETQTPSSGARHMAAQISDGGAWRRLTALLDAADLDEADEIACVAGALATFGQFERSYRLASVRAPADFRPEA